MTVQIVKADGSTEAFQERKLISSLRKAGASKTEIAKILERISTDLYNGITTEEIYRKAFAYLRENEVPVAARYSLRRALFGLGPTGFPFEDFMTRIFEAEGYTVQTGNVIQGSCVPHEIDISAYTDTHAFVAELKFHARPGIKSDLQVALYCYARKLDLETQKICSDDHCGISDFMIVTNTKFTSMARKYATCVGLNLLSWDYPKKNSLHERIRATGLYPISVLQSLSGAQKRALMEQKIIVCSDIIEKPDVLRELRMSQKKIETVLSEARQLCAHT